MEHHGGIVGETGTSHRSELREVPVKAPPALAAQDISNGRQVGDLLGKGIEQSDDEAALMYQDDGAVWGTIGS